MGKPAQSARVKRSNRTALAISLHVHSIFLDVTLCSKETDNNSMERRKCWVWMVLTLTKSQTVSAFLPEFGLDFFSLYVTSTASI